EVSAGIEQVHDKLAATMQLEWHSPAGNAFREAVGTRQEHAHKLRETSMQTATLAGQGIDELRIMIASLQTLLAAARSAVGATAGTAVAATGACVPISPAAQPPGGRISMSWRWAWGTDKRRPISPCG